MPNAPLLRYSLAANGSVASFGMPPKRTARGVELQAVVYYLRPLALFEQQRSATASVATLLPVSR
eukprot:4961932-Pleurochrysis_carterae.AAC.1